MDCGLRNSDCGFKKTWGTGRSDTRTRRNGETENRDQKSEVGNRSPEFTRKSIRIEFLSTTGD